MSSEVLPADPAAPELERIARAAAFLRAGRLVAFPTETVYGLGADALNPAAVSRIFVAKGRPPNNPLIVHVPETAAASAVAAAWPDSAARLAAKFWPGPLTLVLLKREIVPDVVTAGGPTVGVRVPAHPVAQALLREAGIPIAAPSANRSNQLSPTRAEHVLKGLSGRIDLVLDGGPTLGGLESTVLDLTSTPPRLLRPGLVSPGEIEAVIGPIARAAPTVAGPLRSPGMLPRHYAPRTPLECAGDDAAERVHTLCAAGLRVGWLTFTEAAETAPAGLAILVMPRNPAAYAAELYAALHVLDDAGLDRIVVTLPPDREEWLPIHDRLRRAAAPPA